MLILAAPPTQHHLRLATTYDPITGAFRWADSFTVPNLRYRDSPITGSIGRDGRRYVRFNGDSFLIGELILRREFDIVAFQRNVVHLDGDVYNTRLDNLAENENWFVRPFGGKWRLFARGMLGFAPAGDFDSYDSACHEGFYLDDPSAAAEQAPDQDPLNQAEREFADWLSRISDSRNICEVERDLRVGYRVRFMSEGGMCELGTYETHGDALAARNKVFRRVRVDKDDLRTAVLTVRGETRRATKYIDKHGTGWRARAYRDGKLVHVGTFASEDAAIAARDYVMDRGLSVFDAASKARAAFPDPEPTSAAVNPRAKRFRKPRKPRVADGVKYPKGWDRERAMTEGRAPVTAEPNLADLFNAS